MCTHCQGGTLRRRVSNFSELAEWEISIYYSESNLKQDHMTPRRKRCIVVNECLRKLAYIVGEISLTTHVVIASLIATMHTWFAYHVYHRFPLCQFPIRQFPLCQFLTLSIPTWSMLAKWEVDKVGIDEVKLTKWELTKWELTKWE